MQMILCVLANSERKLKEQLDNVAEEFKKELTISCKMME